MKRLTALLISAVTVLSSCKDAYKEEASFAGGEKVEFSLENVCAFDADENGNVFAYAFGSDVICTYDSNGNLIESAQAPKNLKAIEASEKGLYTLTSNELFLNGESVYKLPITKSAIETEYGGGKIYILYSDCEQELSNAPSIDGISFWKGTKITCLDPDTLEETAYNCKYPLLMSMFGDTLWVLAVDSDGTYITDGKNKFYVNTGSIHSFCAVRDDGSFLHDGMSEYATATISFYDVKNSCKSDLIPNAGSLYPGGIKNIGGNIYYLNSSDAQSPDKIVRVKASEYMKNSAPVTMLSLEKAWYYPFGCGRAIVNDKKTPDEFALSVLSRDKNFDLCILSSLDDISGNIRDKGSFYALNEVGGVTGYIDRLFPALKEAAYNSYGEIWMLPVSMNVYCWLYSKERENELPENMSIENIFAFSEKLFSEAPERNDISVEGLRWSSLLIRIMLSESKGNIPDNFRIEAEKIKSMLNAQCFSVGTALNAGNTALMTGGESMLLMLSGDKSIQTELLGKGCRAAAISGLPAPAECSFICVNPNSAHLKETLAYISDLCEYLQNKQDSLLFADSNSITNESTSLYEVYKDARLYFTVSDEVFYDDFLEYCGGAVSYDEFIAEARRKLKIYLNE